jgi:hypothetical protein
MALVMGRLERGLACAFMRRGRRIVARSDAVLTFGAAGVGGRVGRIACASAEWHGNPPRHSLFSAISVIRGFLGIKRTLNHTGGGYIHEPAPYVVKLRRARPASVVANLAGCGA